MWHSSIYTWHILLILGYFLHHGVLSLYLRKVFIMYARQTPLHDKWTFKDQQLMNPFKHINNYRVISRIYNRMGDSMPYFYNSPILAIPCFWSTNRIYGWRSGRLMHQAADWLVPLGGYLKWKYGLSREEVMQRIAYLRKEDIRAYKTSPETPIQVDMVRNYRLRRNIINR